MLSRKPIFDSEIVSQREVVENRKRSHFKGLVIQFCVRLFIL